MRVNSKPPLGQKPAKRVVDKAYMAKVAQLPCVICEKFGMQQNSRTEVHHCKSGRFGFRRASDTDTIPLCHSHHNKLWAVEGDEDKVGYHDRQETFERLYGLDTDYIQQTKERTEE